MFENTTDYPPSQDSYGGQAADAADGFKQHVPGRKDAKKR